jgi:NAD(P)-dependent dehydrogenase (short-subunit alcohol dehydrogenase family)
MEEQGLEGRVALVTGGAQGIGAAVAARLAGLGASVVVADIDEVQGRRVAGEVGGTFVGCDVGDPGASLAAVEVAVSTYGGLDLVHLNAGITTGCGLGDDFDLDRYRRAMAVNLDGVVFGIHAALPALRARGGGRIVATSSLAGLVAVPMDPVYAANKHAVVGLVRSLGPGLLAEGIRINAICPAFADTAIIDDIRDVLAEMEVPLIEVGQVVDTFVAILDSDEVGQCWFVQPGRESEPFVFRNAPGPRRP